MISGGIIRKHEIKHEFLYLPDYPMAWVGKDLLCKLRAQITFESDGMAALKLRGPEAKILTLMVAEEEEWQLYASKKEIPEMPELPSKIPGIWAEDNTTPAPQTGSECTSSDSKIKARSHSCSL
jgi:hypothetical protein